MKRIAQWIFNGETGESSKTMAAVALGVVRRRRQCHPLDPADFNRCLKLVKAAPEVRTAFPKIRALSREWRGVIDHWDEIRRCFVDEVGWDWSKAGSAPKTFELMKRIEQESRRRRGRRV